MYRATSLMTSLMTLLLTALTLNCGVNLLQLPTMLSQSINLLLDPSFETFHGDGVGSSAAWTTTTRRSMWQTDRSHPVPVVCGGEIGGRTGSCSLSLGQSIEGDDDPDHMVFVSQFVDGRQGSTPSDRFVDGPLLIDFWTYLGKSDDVELSSTLPTFFHLLVDVSYSEAGRHFSVRVSPRVVDVKDTSPAASADRKSVNGGMEKFVRTCVVVPHYGRIRALMVHLVADGNVRQTTQRARSPIYVDDVSISYLRTDAAVTESLNDTCELYVDSFPRGRHVIADFLSPVSGSNTGDGSVAVTLATQLTVDRLQALERIASSWQGDVSATLLLYDRDMTSQYLTLRDVTEIYYRSPSLRSHVTLHVVREDAANRKRNRQQHDSLSRDALNDDDWQRYPVNFLRNVAIAHARTSHVFYVDADLRMTFSESDARRWVTEASDEYDIDKTAFLVPVFEYTSFQTAEETVVDVIAMPRTKTELLDRLRDESGMADKLGPLAYFSHSVVDYRRWYSASRPYHVDYQENMEPYFIVRSTAPVMNDLYAGYGRDKCAYSRDVAAAGFRFAVLPDAFLAYVTDPPSVPTIYRRSNGVRPEMFFSVEFHRHDIEAGHFRLPGEYNLRQHRERSPPHKINASGVNEKTEDPSRREDTEQQNCVSTACFEDGKGKVRASLYTFGASNLDEPDYFEEKDSNRAQEQQQSQDDDGDDCTSGTIELHPVPAEMLVKRPGAPLDRIDIAVEMLMMTYGVVTYVELSTSSTVDHRVNLMLPLMQPEAVVTVQLGSTDGGDVGDGHVINGLFETYRSLSSPNDHLMSVLNRVAADHPGPKLYAAIASRFPVERLVAYLKSLLVYVTDDDIVAVFQTEADGSSTSAAVLHEISCSTSITAIVGRGWRLHHLSEQHWIAKPVAMITSPSVSVPPFPVCPGQTKQSTKKVDKVDIVLFSKNRPMQTFAFLESLSAKVSGVGTVWIIVKSESRLIEDGYQLTGRCFNHGRSSFRVVFIPDDEPFRDLRGNVVRQNVAQTFGQTLIDILRMRSNTDHVMFAVDEMIWLRPVDLRRAARQLKHCDSGKDADEVFSVQLRLGENIAQYDSLPDRDQRFRAINVTGSDGSDAGDTSDRMYAFYPRRWPYDFGYVLNVDGVIARRRDLLADFNRDDSGRISDCRTPGCVEDKWIRWSLRRRSRQWHVMYGRRSTVVNNVLPEDGRVSGSRSGDPSEGSGQLAERLVVERRKIDVDAFVEQYADEVRATHVRLPVKYTTLDNNCE